MKRYFLSIKSKQKMYRIVSLCFILLLSTGLNSLKSQEDNGYKIRTVVIDPGHGGKDSGAVGKKSKEKNIVLKIALKLGHYIEENIPDVKVIFTRTTDVFVPLSQRADIANRNKADLFISIHCNGNESSRAYGTETFAMGLHKTQGNLEVAMKENAAILLEEDYSAKYEGFEPNSSESYIIFSLTQDTYLEQSLEYASFVQGEFEHKALRKNRGVKQAGFIVLWKTSMPSVLVEAGFITNPTEEKYLMSNQGQDYLASAIYRAFKSYKNTIEKKSSFVASAEENSTSSPSVKETTIENKKVKTDTNDNKHPREIVKKQSSSTKQKEASIKKSYNNPIEVKFAIQIASSSKPIPLDSDYFKGLQNIREYSYPQGYKYTIGQSDDYEGIVSIRNYIEDYFPDAFIVAVKNKKEIITVQEAQKILKN